MTLTEKLQKMAESKTEREQRAIANLIGRIKFFASFGDEEKLAECQAEANLWGVR